MKATSRPDLSNYLAHFTSGRPPVGSSDATNPAKPFTKMAAFDRLVKILTEKKILASTMPWTGSRAVCFTECPWSSLIDHTTQYSPFGIGFSKKFIFALNGSPVFYVRADQWGKQVWDKHLMAFATPFWPAYRPASINKKKVFPTCDYTHEREWRVPHDLPFDYYQIEFIILDKYEDMAKFPKALKDSIGREKFLLMDNYKMIEKLWPVHNLGL